MAQMKHIDDVATASVAICAAAAALAFPPVTGNVASVPASWGTPNAGVVSEFDLDINSTGALTLTAAELYAGKLRALVVADIAVDSVDHTADEITEAAHGLLTGDGPLYATTADTLPAGLALATPYWVIKTGVNTFKLAASLALALAGTAVALTSNGVGALTLSDDSSATSRVVFHSLGALTASISLDVQKAWSRRIQHSNGVVCYALSGTLSAGLVSARIVPVRGL